MKDLIQLASDHKAAIGVAAMWVVRETPLIWAQVVKIYPYVSEHGGVLGLVKDFFVGKQQPKENKPT